MTRNLSKVIEERDRDIERLTAELGAARASYHELNLAYAKLNFTHQAVLEKVARDGDENQGQLLLEVPR